MLFSLFNPGFTGILNREQNSSYGVDSALAGGRGLRSCPVSGYWIDVADGSEVCKFNPVGYRQGSSTATGQGFGNTGKLGFGTGTQTLISRVDYQNIYY